MEYYCRHHDFAFCEQHKKQCLEGEKCVANFRPNAHAVGCAICLRMLRPTDYRVVHPDLPVIHSDTCMCIDCMPYPKERADADSEQAESCDETSTVTVHNDR